MKVMGKLISSNMITTSLRSTPSSGSPSGPIHREKNYQLDWNHGNDVFRGSAALRVDGTWHAAKFGALGANTWYHLAATFDGTSLKSYQDGVLITDNPAACIYLLLLRIKTNIIVQRIYRKWLLSSKR